MPLMAYRLGSFATAWLVNPESLQNFEAPHNAIGHQGLFFERFYAAAGESLLTDPPLTLADPAAGLPTGLYHNRNRWYSPSLGRFINRDPNETAMPLVAALVSNGESCWILLNAFDPTGHYADGLNLYAYLGSNPLNALDALGLSYDPFDAVDQVIGGIFASRVSAAMDFYRFFEGVALTAGQMAIESMVCAMVPGGAFIVGAYHMGHAGADISVGGLTWGSSLEMAFGAAPVAGKLIGGFSTALAGMRSRRAVAAVGAATGQLHHAISMRIWKALERNPATSGKYRCRDPRFVTRARDAASHRGYQGWHRKLDRSIARWIDEYNPTPEQFEGYLRRRYSEPRVLERFPEGL